jgi:preprotein translocase subunit SecA
MDRMGMEEGEYIESKLVTRSIEKAQKKVEAMHYESRKNILEYDDVANFQRKAIYTFRNQLMDPEYDIEAKIDQNREELVDYLLQEAEIFEGQPSEDYDLDRFTSLVREYTGVEIPVEALKGKEAHEIREETLKTLREYYEAKMSIFDEEQRKEIEKILMLQILDTEWREHLYEMDVLKTGIGLRGYNQKDPLTEYKQESYRLFEALVRRIKFESLKLLYLVQFDFSAPEEELAAAEKMLEELEIDDEELITSEYQELPEDSTDAQHTPYVAPQKPKRNDPCPCGSGKKYKNCCGKSGPKKGLLA